jgi:hypothetical protein
MDTLTNKQNIPVTSYKKIFSKTVKLFLGKIEKTVGISNIILVIQELFRFLMQDLHWLKYTSFVQVVKQKIIELKKDVYLDDLVFFREAEEVFGFTLYCCAFTQSNLRCGNKTTRLRCKVHQRIYEKKLACIVSIIVVRDISKLIVDYV